MYVKSFREFSALNFPSDLFVSYTKLIYFFDLSKLGLYIVKEISRVARL